MKWVVVLSMLITSSCATILADPAYPIYIDSNRPGSVIYLADENDQLVEVGSSPATVMIDLHQSIAIFLKNDGEILSQKIERYPHPYIYLNMLNSWVGLIVDAFSGYFYAPYTLYYYFDFNVKVTNGSKDGEGGIIEERELNADQ